MSYMDDDAVAVFVDKAKASEGAPPDDRDDIWTKETGSALKKIASEDAPPDVRDDTWAKETRSAVNELSHSTMSDMDDDAVAALVDKAKASEGAPPNVPDDIWAKETRSVVNEMSEMPESCLIKMICKGVELKEAMGKAEEAMGKVEQLKGNYKKLDDSHEQLKGNYKELDDSHKQLKGNYKELEKRSEITEAFSMARIYRRESEDGPQSHSLPRIQINPTCSPSLNSKQRRNYEIPCAQIEACRSEKWIDAKVIKTPVYKLSDIGTKQSLPSALGARVEASASNGFLTYSNEVDVQTLCENMVLDAIKSLGLQGTVEVKRETAMYSLVPDIIIVKIDGKIVFVIEVKSPEHESGQVFKNGYVGGQMWLYMMAMKQHGCEKPLGAIMTYNKICLVSLDDDNPSPGIMDEFRKLKETIQPLEVAKPPKVDKSKPSPQKPKIRVCEKNMALDSDRQLTTPLVHKAMIYCSEVFVGDAVFPTLLQGIFTAVKTPESCSSVEKLPVVRHGDRLGHRLFVNMTSSEWPLSKEDLTEQAAVAAVASHPTSSRMNTRRGGQREMSNKSGRRSTRLSRGNKALGQRKAMAASDMELGVDDPQELGGSSGPDESVCQLQLVTTHFKLFAKSLEKDKNGKLCNSFPMSKAKKFLMLAPLGEGNHGFCYIACTHTGILCCIKMLTPARPTENLPDDRRASWDKSIVALRSKADEEAKRWEELYGDECRSINLGGVPAIVMPYAIEIEKDHRLQAIDEIREVLMKFASKGYSYRNEDLRWRHVLRRANGLLVLADLGSLDKNVTKGQEEDYVKKQIDILRSRSGCNVKADGKDGTLNDAVEAAKTLYADAAKDAKESGRGTKRKRS